MELSEIVQRMPSVRAYLARKSAPTLAKGEVVVKDEIPIGKEYEAYPGTLSSGLFFDQVTGTSTRTNFVLVKHTEDNQVGWFPVDLLSFPEESKYGDT